MIDRRVTYIILCIITTVSLLSCSKKAPEGQQGDVVFRFNGIIDTAVVFEAGENNYFMNTDYTDNGPNDILIMKGEFIDKTNTDDNFLRFEFFGYDSVNNSGVVQNVFNQSNFVSYSADTAATMTGYTLRFRSLYGTGANIMWDFGDGNSATGDSAVHTFSPNLLGSSVSMSSFYTQANCGDSVSNYIDLTDPVNNQVQFNISTSLFTLDSFAFDATGGFTNYSWDFGNSTTFQGGNPFASVIYTDSFKKTIELVATKFLTTSTWRAVVTPNANPCFAAFIYDVLSTPSTTVTTRSPYKTCVITYKRNDITYSSFKNDNSNQSGRNVFTLNSALPYDNNAAGQRTVRLIGSINTFLYNINNVNDSIPIVAGNVSIAVAHP